MKKENLPWIIIITCTILLCLIAESWVLPACKTLLQLSRAFCQAPSASMPLPFLGLDQAGEAPEGIKSALTRYFIPCSEVL